MMRRAGMYTSIAGAVLLLISLILRIGSSDTGMSAYLLAVGGIVLLVAGFVSGLGTRMVQGKQPISILLMFTGSIVVFIIIIVVNILANRFPMRTDVTRTGRYTLSGQTSRILASLSGEVRAVGFFADGEGIDARDLLTEYDAASRMFSFRFVDPDRNPEEAMRYNIREYGTVVFESGDRQERISDHSENRYTSALARLVSGESDTVAFVTGHGERNISDSHRDGLSTMATRLREEGFAVTETMILRDGLPSSDAVLVFAGPRTPLLPTETESLTVFVSGGGRVICCLEPDGASLSGFLETAGISPRDDTIIDASGLGSLFGMSEVVPLVATYDQNHEITSRFDAATFFPLCRSLSIADSIQGGHTTDCLAFTSDASWGEAGGDDMDQVVFDEGVDTPGPLCVFAVAEQLSPADADSSAARDGWAVAVFGDVDFASNGYCDVSANGDLLLNTISWMSHREGLMGIRPKEADGGPIMLSSQTAHSIFFLVVVLMPGIPLVTGISLWLRRR